MPNMKKLSLAILLFIFTKNVIAQKNKKDEGPSIPKFGVVEKADLEMKDCDFDEKAPAVVLIDDGDMDFVYGNGLGMDRRVRIKILNKDGLDWANVHISYRK